MLLSYILGFLAVVIWAILPVFTKQVFDEMPSSYFLVFRFFFSSIIFVFIIPRILKKLKNISKKILFKLFITIGLTYYFQTQAITQLPVTWYVLIFSLNPILSVLFLNIKIDKKVLSSFGCAIIGVFFF